MYPNVENMIVVPIRKRMGIITSIQACLISRMNVNYKENGEKKSFLAYPKHQYHVLQLGEHDCSAHKEKNGDYNEYPSLSHFTNQL